MTLAAAATMVALSNPWAYQALACYDREKLHCYIVDEGFADKIGDTLKRLEGFADGTTELLASFSQSNGVILYSFDRVSQSWSNLPQTLGDQGRPSHKPASKPPS